MDNHRLARDPGIRCPVSLTVKFSGLIRLKQ
jgi:hypothetical protein